MKVAIVAIGRVNHWFVMLLALIWQENDAKIMNQMSIALSYYTALPSKVYNCFRNNWILVIYFNLSQIGWELHFYPYPRAFVNPEAAGYPWNLRRFTPVMK